ncbi:ABC transporter ATP-binding protein, partial [Rhodobaculum claviforme]
MSNLVEIRDLHIKARTDANRVVEIIQGVDIDIAEGEIVALIGESGSGKTTIALSVMGYQRDGCFVSEGEVRLDGHDVYAMGERERQALRGTEVSYVPQSAAAAFNPSQTIMSQVIEVSNIHGLMSPDEARAKAVELFRALTLPDPDNIGARYPHQVSGGQLQRLSAAMALIGNPRLVIFDEPTTALDVTTQIEVLRAFKSVMTQSRMAGIYVSHDLAVVAQIADRIVVLKDGEIQETGRTQQILESPTHDYTKALVAAVAPVPHTEDRAAMSAAQPVLEADGLVAGYGRLQAHGMPAVVALKDVSLELWPGRN